jgi:hypothetical protein
MPSDERRGVIITEITGDYWGYNSKVFWDWLADAFRRDLG